MIGAEFTTYCGSFESGCSATTHIIMPQAGGKSATDQVRNAGARDRQSNKKQHATTARLSGSSVTLMSGSSPNVPKSAKYATVPGPEISSRRTSLSGNVMRNVTNASRSG